MLQTQLTLAASMQRRLLPAAPAPDHGFEWAAVQIPAGRIGGDFYDFMNRSMLGGGPSGVEAWSDDRTMLAFTVGSK